ncbi:hypothetical protein BCR34DRAFT_100394 [Clohesyomyces aquaticus]|uniref:Uncharacterized protein n=1 Tax=Clohesyomyces aquaticus TaxID=1231657 RepID=A0A1Y1YUE9_9PLEO|nr:hypothetical protein BCR34DRAFT_100394 [Clohesyomyces aquaticus]
MGDSPPSSIVGSFSSGTSSSPTLIDSAPFLPQTPYLDSAPTVPRPSDGLLSMQIRVLELLRLQAADSLTASHLAALTRDINPSVVPDPQEALRLCYYMRQLGIATYSRLEEKQFRCFLANPNYRIRNDINDVCYWNQEYNGTVTLREPVSRRPRHSRRNAMPGLPDAMLNGLGLRPSGGFEDEEDEDEDAQLAAAIQASLGDGMGSRESTGGVEASGSGAGPAVASGSLQVPVQQHQEPRATMPPVSQQAPEEPPPPPVLNQGPPPSSSRAIPSDPSNIASFLVHARVARAQRPEGHTHPRPSSPRPGRADDPHALVHQFSSALSRRFVPNPSLSPILGQAAPSGSRPGQRSSSEPPSATASASRPAPSPLSVAGGELSAPSTSAPTSSSGSHIQPQNSPPPAPSTRHGHVTHQTALSTCGRRNGRGRGSGAFSAQTRFGEDVHASFHSQFSGAANAGLTQIQNSGSGSESAPVEMASRGGQGRGRGQVPSEGSGSGPSNLAGRGGRGTGRWDVMPNPHSASRGGLGDGDQGARGGA